LPPGQFDWRCSDYFKQILDFDNRDDKEIIKFFTILQEKFYKLNHNLWVNIFDSFDDRKVDYAPEDDHPGIKSHRWMADQVINYLNTNKIL